MPNATPVGEVMRYRLKGDGKTPTELRTLQDWVVERTFRQVPGVADVVGMGGFIKQYEVQPDLQKLRAYKLTLQDLQTALGRSNANAGGGYVAQGAQQFAIRGIGLLGSVDDIGTVVVTTRGNTPILVRDVAKVSIGAVARLGTVGQDLDDDVVTGIIIMRKGENPSLVLKGVKERLDDLNARVLPQVYKSSLFTIAPGSWPKHSPPFLKIWWKVHFLLPWCCISFYPICALLWRSSSSSHFLFSPHFWG